MPVRYKCGIHYWLLQTWDYAFGERTMNVIQTSWADKQLPGLMTNKGRMGTFHPIRNTDYLSDINRLVKIRFISHVIILYQMWLQIHLICVALTISYIPGNWVLCVNFRWYFRRNTCYLGHSFPGILFKQWLNIVILCLYWKNEMCTRLIMWIVSCGFTGFRGNQRGLVWMYTVCPLEFSQDLC